jgi:transcriptional regulator
MYVPSHFAETRPELLQQAIRDCRLPIVVTLADNGMEASHIPLLYDPTPAADGSAPHGTLYGHVARANRQWQRFRSDIDSLAIFQGPEFYVTPSWYETKRETGKVVPTWNYIVVHAYGRLRAFEDPAELRDLVTRLTERHEGERAKPWAVSDAPSDYIDAHVKGIVGLALPISRLEGKWKLSQNRNAADRAGVAEGLRDDGQPMLAKLVADAGKDR